MRLIITGGAGFIGSSVVRHALQDDHEVITVDKLTYAGRREALAEIMNSPRHPWQNALGLAVSDGPGEPFRRLSRFPIVPLDETDPDTISYPWVIRENGRFRMWYGSNVEWGARKEDMRHLIKYAESDDGIHWERENRIAIDFGFPGEYAICKPCVLPRAEGYEMWFCSRGEKYRIRLARSRDGIEWTRCDQEVGLDVSAEGWDSEMIEYPCVFDHAGRSYMLYSGNGFGAAGFGLAVLE